MNESSVEVTHNKQASAVGNLLSVSEDKASSVGYNRYKYTTMQESNPQMASIPEDGTHSNRFPDNMAVPVVTSAPISIPAPVTRNCSTFDGMSASPAFSQGSFMIRRFSSPSLSSMCYKCERSPISCHTVSTQTPHADSHLNVDDRDNNSDEDLDCDLDVGEDDDDDDDDDDDVLLPNVPGDRWRSFSMSTESRSVYPLPDLLEFRNRSHSEGEAARPEIEVGRELRRISDEFHHSYQECRVIRYASVNRPDDGENFFWRIVGTIRRRASFSRGNSV